MKSIITIAVIFISVKCLSQNTMKAASIDSIVNVYNNSNFEQKKDSIIKSLPDVGMEMKTYITVLTDAGKLKKYASKFESSRKTANGIEQMEGYNIFYFNEGRLIKVDEGMHTKEKQGDARWYFDNDKMIHYKITPENSIPGDKAEERGKFLIEAARALLEKVNP